jgi:two-component system, OmpR family, response regulator TrcR
MCNPDSSQIIVILVEDEPDLAAIVKDSLKKRGFVLHVAHNGVQGWELFKRVHPDLCIVDVRMPRKDGFSLVEDIRLADNQVPILFLTGRTQMEDVIRRMQLGADDYVKKPFNMEEVLLRVSALLQSRIDRQKSVDVSDIRVGTFLFRLGQLELIHGSERISLSHREADLLSLLLQRKNELLERKVALIKLWGDDNAYTARCMDVYITRLRKIFKRDPGVKIVNKRGQGYALRIPGQ